VLRAAAQRRLAACAPLSAPDTLRLTPATQRAGLTDTSVSLARRSTLWRLLAALAEAHTRGVALPQDTLFAAGWPDERAEPDSRKKRVQTAVWTLRRLLLGDHLHTRPEGYALSAELRVVFERD
jgi:DNA-binding SARP family transcriptional activator